MSEPRKRKRKGERPDGRIQVTLKVGIDSDGKPIRKSFYGATRKEAEAKRNEYVNSLKAGLDPLSENITLEEWIDQWEQLYSIDMSNKRKYANRLKQDLGSLPLRDIKEAHLIKSLHDGFAGKSTGTARAYRNFIRNIFKKALKNHLIAEDPADDLDLPKTTSGSHRALEQWEIDCILKYHHLSQGGLLALIMLLTGTRRGECMALNWDTSIDMENREFHIHSIVDYYTEPATPTVVSRTKTKSGQRTIPMCQYLFDILNRTPTEERHGLIFSESGKPLRMSRFISIWSTFLNKVSAQLEREEDEQHRTFYCTPHDLRHTYATLLYDAGVDIKTAQSYLGHASAQMTMEIYTHLSATKKNHSKDLLVKYLDSITLNSDHKNQ